MSEVPWEKSTLKIDAERLRDDVTKFNVPPVMVNNRYGGWSVTSSDGSYTDGWLHRATSLIVDPSMSVEEYRRYSVNVGLARPLIDYIKPTEICTPYLKSLIDEWKDAGLYPLRVRIALMKGGHVVPWHQDAPDSVYSARLHAAIETNPGCILESKSEQLHIPADGSVWFVRVNQIHRARNDGSTDRLHLMANIFDTKGITKTMKYDPK